MVGHLPIVKVELGLLIGYQLRLAEKRRRETLQVKVKLFTGYLGIAVVGFPRNSAILGHQCPCSAPVFLRLHPQTLLI